MEVQRGVVVLAYKPGGRNLRFLVLKRVKNWEGWELPKGHMEESPRETALQELEEEAGISEEEVRALESTETQISWETDDGKRVYEAFIAEVEPDAVVEVSGNPHEEHERGHFLRFRDAEALLTYDEHVDLLDELRERLPLD